MLVEKQGRVSIWLNTHFEERNKSIGWYDHDHMETGRTSEEPLTLREHCAGFSYAKSWIDAAEAAAAAPGVPAVHCVWMLFGHEYTGTPGPIDNGDSAEGDGAYFLGVFDYGTGR